MKHLQTFENFIKSYGQKLSLDEFEKIAIGQIVLYKGIRFEVKENTGVTLILTAVSGGQSQRLNLSQFNQSGAITESEVTINEKIIRVDWEDDENAIIFSDAGLIKVNYDGDFKYRGKWFATVDHTGPDDLLKDLTKAFKSDKFVYVNEFKHTDAFESLSRKKAKRIRRRGEDLTL